jgi:hypothetical protein
MTTMLSAAMIFSLGFVGRVLPHPNNVTPLVALAIMSGIMMKSRWKSIAVVVTTNLAADVFLGFYDIKVMAAVYTGHILTAVLSNSLDEKKGFVKTLSKSCSLSLISSWFFFLTTNFVCWGTENMYPPTLEGLYMSYVAAIPFFKNSLMGDQFWTFCFLGSYFFVKEVGEKAQISLEAQGT